MYKKFNKLIASCASAAFLCTSIGINPVSTFATTLENDTAVAGMAVSLNNYYANSYSPEADILNYLNSVVASPAETEQTTAAAVNANVKTDVGTIQGTAEADDLIDDDEEGQEYGIVSTTNRLLMRKSPSLSAPVVAYLYNNCKVEIFDTISNDDGIWYLIRTDGVEGSVSAEFVLTGADAEAAETNIQNKYATILTDSLDLYDSAASAGKVIETVYKDETYPVLQASGDYVMIKVSDTVWGYVRRDSVKITTQFAEAVAIDDNFIKERLESYITETDDAKRVYDERMSVHDYTGAKSAIDYCVEIWDQYIQTAKDAGMTDLVTAAEKQRSDAAALSEAVGKIIADLQEEASQNVVTPSAPSSVPTVDQTTAPSDQSTAEPGSEPESQPTGKTAVKVEARYIGGQKYAGDVISASELYLHVWYEDGTEADITDPSAWSSPDVGMNLAEGDRVVTMYYGSLHSSFLLPVYPAAESQVPSVPATEPQVPTEPVTEPQTPTEPVTQTPTEPATEPQVPTEPVTEPQTPTEPVTEPETPSAPAAVVTPIQIEARYTGGQKYAGDVISASELYIHVWYSDGTENDITDSSVWSSPDVGMVLSEGEKTVTMYYGDLQSSFSLTIAAAATEPTPTEPAAPQPEQTEPAAPQPEQTEPAAPQPEQTEPPVTEPEPTEPVAPQPTVELSAARQQVVNYAQQWVGQCNYVFGNTNLTVGGSVDCSGFTMRVYETVGISLPHFSGDQRWAGTQITYEQLRPGDLIYYSGHVAIYIGNDTIVHAKNEQSGIVYDPVVFNPAHPPLSYISLLP